MHNVAPARSLLTAPPCPPAATPVGSVKGAEIITLEGLGTLECLIDQWGPPAFIRSDNGPEFIAQIIQDWCDSIDVQTLYIKPGSPWQNGFIESFHSRFRDECLSQEIFYSIAETHVVVEDYRRFYNTERPHSSLGYKTPDEFAHALKDQLADQRRISHPK